MSGDGSPGSHSHSETPFKWFEVRDRALSARDRDGFEGQEVPAVVGPEAGRRTYGIDGI
jgi:hypothetical protein